MKRLKFSNFFLSKTFSTKKANINLQDISKKFWKNKTGDYDSMCGFKELNEEDIQHSSKIFSQLPIKQFNSALDVGSGIGRITFNCLHDKCSRIDLLDLNENFLNIAKEKEKEIGGNKINDYYACELKNFKFSKSYDLIFIQWVLEYLSDEELNVFMNKVFSNLTENGITIIKENVSVHDEPLIYLQEGSLIRNPTHFERIFTTVGLRILASDFVKFHSVDDLCDIKYWILQKESHY